MSSRTPVVVVLALLAALVGGVLALDQLVPPVDPGADEAADVEELATGGAWVCPVGDTREDTSLAVSAMRPGETGDTPGEVELGIVEDGEQELDEATQIFPLSAVRLGLEGDEAAVTARWFDGPVGLHRTWRLRGGDDLPPGTVAGPCVAEVSDRWLIPGMTTSGGNEARLRLANPHRSDATVQISFATPEGVESPTVLQNITVQARDTTEIEVNEHLPERDDVAAEVRVVSGRVAAAGYQLARQAIGDVDGASLLASATTPSTVWTVPWVADGDGRQSWLWLLNPGQRPAPVELTLHTPDGGVVPDGLAEVTVAPGQLRRIDLRGTFPEDVASGAVTVRSDGEPVVASGTVRQDADDAEDTGIAVQLGAIGDTRWLFAGGGTAGRNEQLRLVNPEGTPAVVDVVLFDGSQTLRSEELTDVEVPPGALVALDLTAELGEVESWAAFVEASEGQVVAGNVGRGGAAELHLVAGPGVSGASLDGARVALPSRREPGVSLRVGTDLGIRTADEDEAAPAD
jgi:hypothetical protein